MFDDLPETVLRRMACTLADMSFDSITVTRSTKAGGPKIIYVNDAFTDLTGYGASDVIGHTPGMLQGADTDPAVLKRLDETVARGDTFHGTAVNYRKDGTPFDMEWKVSFAGSDEDAEYYLAVQRAAR
jgi:PAS domain S-box-containing protein